MKNLFLSTLCAVTALGLSSCCCLFSSNNSYKSKKTVLAGHTTVTKEVAVSGSKSGYGSQTVTESVPVYEEKIIKHRIKCVRKYCPKKGPCGTTGETVIKMATAQGGVGSPHIGLIPTMKPLAP